MVDLTARQRLRIQVLENRVRWHQEQVDLAEEEIKEIEALIGEVINAKRTQHTNREISGQ